MFDSIVSEFILFACLEMKYTLQQRIFVLESFLKLGSAEESQRKFRRKYPGHQVPSCSTIRKITRKFRKTGSVLDIKKGRSRRVLTEKKIREIGALLQYTPGKSSRRLGQETGMSPTSALRAIRMLKAQLSGKNTQEKQTSGETTFSTSQVQ